MKLLYIQEKLSVLFLQLGQLIARHTVYFIAVPIIITSILATGFLKMKIIRNVDEIFTADRGRAFNNKKLVDRVFPANTSNHADFLRVTSINDLTTLIITARDEGSILREHILDEILEVDRIIKNVTVEWNGNDANYSILCGKDNGRCFETELLEIISHGSDILRGKYKIQFPKDIQKVTLYSKQYGTLLGGVTLDKNDYVQDAKALRLLYLLDFSDVSKLRSIADWEGAVSEVLMGHKFENITLYTLNHEILRREIKIYSDKLLPLAPKVIAIIGLFSIVTCMTNNWVRSKPWLGVSACFSAVLAITSGIGLALYCGLEYLDFILALGFAILGTEVDDAYVLISAWRSTNLNDSVEKRMGKTYSDAAVSITITSLTSFLSFCIGISAEFKIVRLFCIYSAILIFFTYVYQITFFGACMALSGYREKKRLHPFTFQVQARKDEENHNANDKELATDLQEEFIMVQFRDKIGSLLTYNPVKISVLIIFLVTFALSVWGVGYMKVGNSFEDALSFDSKSVRVVDLNYKYFNRYSFPINIIINEKLNYANESVQISINKMLEKFYSHPNIADESNLMSWLKYYKIFYNDPFKRYLIYGYNLKDKQDFIDGLREVFFNIIIAKKFRLDVAFNENYTEILASRFLIPLKDVDSHEIERDIIHDLYEIAEQSPFKVIVHGFTFHLLEHAFIIKKLTFQLFLMTSGLICVIFFIFIPNVRSVICITLIVFCIIFETIGYMSLWNIKLDVISVTTLILCVGFSINYPTHISFFFITAKNLSYNDRIKKALYEVGYPILQGSLSTILGVAWLSYQPYYSMRSFFKIVLLISLLTALHAMFVIPVVLSLFGQFNEFICKSIKKRRDQ